MDRFFMLFPAYFTKMQNIRIVKESEKVVNPGIKILKINVKSMFNMSKITQYMMINNINIRAK
jgi:hypothetical protein